MVDVATAVPSVPLQPTAKPPQISWSEPRQSFVVLALINTLLRVATLGVYHFWGKTEVRQRIWSAVRVDGEPLEYRGTGGELFRGFLIVFALILLPLGLAGFVVPLLFSGNAALEGSYHTLTWGILLALSGIGMHRARRYRLSRTYYRGIRGGLSGRSNAFAWTYFWTILLVPVTFGWIYPYRALVLYRALTQQTRFGNAALEFTGKSGALYRRFWVVWLGGLVLLVFMMGAIGAVVGPTGAAGPVKAVTAGKVAGVLAVLACGYFVSASSTPGMRRAGSTTSPLIRASTGMPSNCGRRCRRWSG